MTKTIGTITTNDGDEHPYLRGHKLRLVAVLPRAAAPDFAPDRDGRVLRDDDEIERAGGRDLRRPHRGPALARARTALELRHQRPERDRPRVLPPAHEGPLTETSPVTTPGDPAAAASTNAKAPDVTDTSRRTLESLAALRLPELQARFAGIVGEPTRSHDETFLLRKISEALQAREQQTHAEPTTPTTTPAEAAPKVELPTLPVAELQAMYREIVGRETRSSDSAYLVSKLRQAQKGRVRVGPNEGRAPGEAAAVKFPPLRMSAAEVEALDEARRPLGFRSRTAMIRKAIEGLLAS